jgi:hypothetical protein
MCTERQGLTRCKLYVMVKFINASNQTSHLSVLSRHVFGQIDAGGWKNHPYYR